MPVHRSVTRYKMRLVRAVEKGDREAEAVARRDYAEARIAAAHYIEKVVAAAPPLTSEQRDRLAELLRPVRTPAPEPDRQAVVDERIAELDAGAAS